MDSYPVDPEQCESSPIFGDVLAMELRDRLAERISFPDPRGNYAHLSELIQALEGHEIDQESLRGAVTANIDRVVREALVERLENHAALRAADKVLIPMGESEDGEPIYEWLSIRRDDRLQAEAIANEAQESLAADEDSLRFTELVDEQVTKAKQNFTELVSDKAQQAHDLTPPQLPEAIGVIRRLGRLLIGEGVTYSYAFWHEAPGGSEGKRVSRKVYQINEILTNFLAAPEQTIVKYTQKELDADTLQTIRSYVYWVVDEEISGRNVFRLKVVGKDVYIGRPKVSEGQAEAALTKRQARASKSDATDVVTSPIDTSEESGEHAAELWTVGEVIAKLPWMNNQKPTKLHMDRLEYSGAKVYITWAFGSKNLASIAIKSRARPDTLQGEISKFDTMIIQRGIGIASGIMPHIRESNVNHVRASDRGPGYENTPIWYDKDFVTSGPRVYFTLMQLGQIMDLTAIKTINAKPEDHCLVVLAETDKSGQLSVLGELLGQKRAVLRNQGAGQI